MHGWDGRSILNLSVPSLFLLPAMSPRTHTHEPIIAVRSPLALVYLFGGRWRWRGAGSHSGCRGQSSLPSTALGCPRPPSMLACVERPGAPLEPHENGPGGPPFLVSAPPSPASPLSRLAFCMQVPATATRPPPGRRTTLRSHLDITPHAPWRAGDEHMWAAGLRSGVQKGKTRRGTPGRVVGVKFFALLPAPQLMLLPVVKFSALFLLHTHCAPPPSAPPPLPPDSPHAHARP